MAYSFTDKQLLGVWNQTGDSLYARTFNGGASFYLTQKTGDNPDRFVPRGRNLLVSGNVTLASGVPASAYVDLAGGDTAANGLYAPADFATPAGYSLLAYQDGTPYYQQNGNTGCTLTEGLEVGTFSPTGQPLVATFNSGKWYVAQLVNNNPRTYVVRGKNILTSGYATVSLGACVAAFNSEDTPNNGTYEPTSYTTPDGYTKKVYPDNTPYYESNAPTSGAPIITTNASLVNGAYAVTQGQSVTISSNSSDIRWYKKIGSSIEPIPLYTQNITINIDVNNTEIYGVNWNGGALGPQSNVLKFVIGGYTPVQSDAPTVEKTTVVLGQPINVGFCAGAELQVFKNGTQLTPDQIYYVTQGIDTGTSKTLIPQSPVAGDKYKFKVICPGKTLSNFSSEVTLASAGAACDNIGDKTPLGLWNPQNAALVSRKFGSTTWVTQVTTVPGGPDSFVVRAKNILQRSDVTTPYSGCTASFSGSNTGVGTGIAGLVEPSEFAANKPVNYVQKAFPDGTPYYEAITAIELAAPVITSGSSGKTGTSINGTVNQAGTIQVFKDGVQITTITNITKDWAYTPTSSGVYSFKLQNTTGSISGFSGPVLVAGGSNSGQCSINDKQVVGFWTAQGHQMVARLFNNELYVTQQVSANPDTFVVRGRNILSNSAITSTFQDCQGVFGGGDTQEGGLYPPANFVTPSGYEKKTYADSTIYYQAVGGSSGETGTTAQFDLNFNSQCGNVLQYAVSKTIADPLSNLLVYQDSKRFALSSGTWYFHAREKASPQKTFTSTQLITV